MFGWDFYLASCLVYLPSYFSQNETNFFSALDFPLLIISKTTTKSKERERKTDRERGWERKRRKSWFDLLSVDWFLLWKKCYITACMLMLHGKLGFIEKKLVSYYNQYCYVMVFFAISQTRKKVFSLPFVLLVLLIKYFQFLSSFSSLISRLYFSSDWLCVCVSVVYFPIWLRLLQTERYDFDYVLFRWRHDLNELRIDKSDRKNLLVGWFNAVRFTVLFRELFW